MNGWKNWVTSTSDVLNAPRDCVASEPAKAWRNRYWISRRVRFSNGHIYGPGEYLGLYVWPSKDSAETRALEDMERLRRGLAGRGIIHKYLGAEPVTGDGP